MLEDIHFSYDGVKSIDMGLLNVKLDGGMYDEAFLPSREIEETKISGNDKPYFKRVRLNPLEFKLSFAFEFYYDESKIREVARWLMQDYYKPFYTVGNPNRIFYCMLEGDSRLIHNGLKQGYIELNMRCDSPYSYSPKYTVENYEYLNTKLTKEVFVNTFNSGDGYYDGVKIVGNSLQIDSIPYISWETLSGKKWSDI